MKINQRRVKDVFTLTLVVIALQVVLSKLVYPLFGASTSQLFSITPQTAIASPTIGNKILSMLTGIAPFGFSVGTLLAMFLGGFVLIYLGYAIYDQKWAWKGKNQYQRVWAILLYGTIALYVFLLVTKIEQVATLAVPLLIGVAVNYVVIALVVHTLSKRIPALRV